MLWFVCMICHAVGLQTDRMRLCPGSHAEAARLPRVYPWGGRAVGCQPSKEWCCCAQAGLACCCLALEPPPLPLEGGAFFLSPPSFPPGIPEMSICMPDST